MLVIMNPHYDYLKSPRRDGGKAAMKDESQWTKDAAEKGVKMSWWDFVDASDRGMGLKGGFPCRLLDVQNNLFSHFFFSPAIGRLSVFFGSCFKPNAHKHYSTYSATRTHTQHQRIHSLPILGRANRHE